MVKDISCKYIAVERSEKMTRKKVIILGAGPLQVPAIRELKKLGAYVICLDYNPQAEGFEEADESKVISTRDTRAICEEVKRQQPDVLMTSTSDAPVRIISRVSEILGRRCALSYEDACAVTIKSLMRRRLEEHNVVIPKYMVIGDFEALKNAYKTVFHESCILKPADNAGSRGVKLLQGEKTESQLRQEYEQCLSCTGNNMVVIEEIMEGPEVSVEAVTVAGKTKIISITDKIVCERPYFVEVGHVEPSRLAADIQNRIKVLARQAIEAMNITDCPSHTEIIVTEDGPKIVEIAARLGGDFITSRLVPLSTGINMVRASVQMELGERAELERKKSRGAAIRFLSVERSGIVGEIYGVQEALKEPGVTEAVLYVKPGDEVNPLRSSNDRIGHVIAVGRDAQEAWENAGSAYRKIHVVLRK